MTSCDWLSFPGTPGPRMSNGSRIDGSYSEQLALAHTVLAVEEAVVAGEQDQGVVQLARGLQPADDGGHRLVHRQQRFEALLVVLLNRRHARRREQRPALHEGGLVAHVGLVERRGLRQAHGREGVRVPRSHGGCGLAGGVVGLGRLTGVRRQEGHRHEEGLVRRGGRRDQLVRAPGEEIGGVELGLVGRAVGTQRSVLVDRVVVEGVRRGVDRPVPVVEAGRHLGWRGQAAVAVEELAHVHGPVARGLQPERQPVRLVEARVATERGPVAQHAVVVGVLTRVEGRAGGTAQ